MSEPTPDRPDDDEDLESRLVCEAGDPTVVPRPEHVASLRALLLDRLGPPRAARPRKTFLLIGTGLAAACLLAVIAALRGNGTNPVPSPNSGRSAPEVAGRLPDDPDAAELLTFNWPIEEKSPITGNSIPPDLLD